MVSSHSITPATRTQLALDMLAATGHYGAVTALGRAAHLSRQTLYSLRAQARAAVAAAFAPPPLAASRPSLARAVLTLLLEGHNSTRNIQTLLTQFGYSSVGLGSIHTILATAGSRARAWFAAHAPVDLTTLAADEMFGRGRDAAYLSLVDATTGAVWYSAGPLAVDSESWVLVFWEAADQGVTWRRSVSDGGAAIRSAVATVAPGQEHGRDVWHLLHRCAQTQGRLDRAVATARAQVAAGAAYRARKAAGERVAGFAPGQAAAARLPELVRVATSVRYGTEELRRLLGGVVRAGGRVLDAATRAAEVGAVLELLAEVGAGAPAGLREEVGKLVKTLREAEEEMLASSRALEEVQREAEGAVGAGAVDLLAWAWERRAGLGGG